MPVSVLKTAQIMKRGHLMRESVFETLVGLGVVLAAGLFLSYALANGTDRSTGSSNYEVTARFNNALGISPGSDVRLAGVKVGIVSDMEIDYDRIEAVIKLRIDERVELWDDAIVKVSSESLLGGSFIDLDAGGGGYDVIAKDGSGEILNTRGSVDLLTLVGSFASGFGGDGDSGSEKAQED